MSLTKILASMTTFVQAGAGAVIRTVQDKLRATLLDRSDYATSGDFTAASAASPTTPTLDGGGSFGARLVPAGEAAQIDLKSAVLSVAAGPRDALTYKDALSVSLSRRFAVMGGFRYRGQYLRGRAPAFPMPANPFATCAAGGLGAETAAKLENWYAAFAVANAGDAAATVVTMPFLRVGSVAGNVVTLNKAGEGIHTVIAQTYAWGAVNNLAGVECLVISENGGWTGRLTTITANTAGTVTLASAGALAFGDFLLPAPPGKAHYAYLASFYLDTAAVRNIYDSGSLVKAKMIGVAKGKTSGGAVVDYANGSFPPGSGSLTMQLQGYIPPLATAVTIDSQCNFVTTAAGDTAEYFDPDGSSHIIHTCYHVKGAVGETTVFPNVQVPFLYHQSFNWSTAGSRAGDRTSSALLVTGWFEP